MTLLSRACVSP